MADGSDGQNRINTRKALNYYKSQNAEVIIINGDVTDSGDSAAYTKLEEDIAAVYPNTDTRPTFVITEDTHFATNTYSEVNGYHFIGVSSDGMNGEQYIYDSETIAFVSEKLEAANNADSNKPIFLAVHQAPPNTVYGSDGLDCFSSAEMDDLLKQYPNLVVVSSYTHAPLHNDKSIVQDDFTTLNTASLYHAGGLDEMTNLTTGQLGDIYQFGQGLLIRATGKVVDVERCDFYNNEKIKDNWTFKTGMNTEYTIGHTTEVPEFADDAEVSVEWVDDTSVKIAFNAVSNKDSVEYYEVSAYNVSSSTVDVTKKLSSFYWKNSEEMPKSFVVTAEYGFNRVYLTSLNTATLEKRLK
jgi:hypothetical protein